MNHEPYIGLRELAKRATTGLSEGTLYKLATEGTIRAYRPAGCNRILVVESEVLEDIRRHRLGYDKRSMGQSKAPVSRELAGKREEMPEILPMPGRGLRACGKA